jgi:hypothetical protein
MTAENYMKVLIILECHEAVAKADYEIARKDFGDDHAVTQMRMAKYNSVKEALTIFRDAEDEVVYYDAG